LFAEKRYEDATDVYLTCLVAMDAGSVKTCGGSIEHGGKKNTGSSDIDRKIRIPVLLNLSLCALKEGKNAKAEKFCTFALEVPAGQSNAKVFFRRGRARMLNGHYRGAREDLRKSLDLIDTTAEEHLSREDAKLYEREKEAVLKEMEKLDTLELEAEQNLSRQKKAMRKALGGQTQVEEELSSFPADTITTMPTSESSSGKQGLVGSVAGSAKEPLLASKGNSGECIQHHGLYLDRRKHRAFSTLRAKPKRSFNSDKIDGRSEEDSLQQMSYLQWYLSAFERCLRRTLELLGEEIDDEKLEGWRRDEMLEQEKSNGKKKS